MTVRPRPVQLASLAAVAVLGLSACSGEGSGSAEPTPTDAGTPTASASDGAEVTPEGTQLAFGDTASVEYAVGSGAGAQQAVLGLTVDSAVQGQLKDFSGFNLDDPYRKGANYFYVRVTVENQGESKIGGVDVPLWGISGKNTLLPVVKFTSAFKKCPTQPLPKKFKPGAEFKTCLVYLSPDKGSLEGVSFRPTEEYTPIEWHGVVKPAPKEKAKKKG